jgi:hypothetical protein
MARGTPWNRISASSTSAVIVARTLTPVVTLVPLLKAMRAQRWFEAKALATPIMISTLARGDNFASMLVMRLILLVLVLPSVAAACDYPDEGTMPLHRAVTKVKLRPEAEAWAKDWLRREVVVQYALLLDESRTIGGRCYWTVEARAAGSVWRRYYVTPDGRKVLSAGPQSLKKR